MSKTRHSLKYTGLSRHRYLICRTLDTHEIMLYREYCSTTYHENISHGKRPHSRINVATGAISHVILISRYDKVIRNNSGFIAHSCDSTNDCGRYHLKMNIPHSVEWHLYIFIHMLTHMYSSHSNKSVTVSARQYQLMADVIKKRRQ